MNTKRDFIIGSMYGLSGLDVDHFETDRRQLPVVDSAEEAFSIASFLAFGTNPGVNIDVSSICKETLSFITHRRVASVQSGVVLDRLLSLLRSEIAGTVAIQLVHSLREDHLGKIGRGGLLAMRDAAAAVDEAESAIAIRRLDAELARRGPLHFREIEGTLVIGDETRPSAIEFAAKRIRRDHPAPRSKVVVVYRYRPGIDHDLAIAHVRVQIRRSLDRRLWKVVEDVGQANVFTLDERILRQEVSGGLIHSFEALLRSWFPRSLSQRTISRGEAT